LVERRRRLNPEKRRRELLDAAVRVLRRRGPVDCRVEDVTTEAGTAKGNFYRYFPTWEDLLLAVRDHLLDNYADEIRQRLAVRTSADWWEALEEEIDCFIEFQRELGALHDVAFHGSASRARPIDEERQATTIIATFLARGIAAGAFTAVDVNPTAALIFYVLHGAVDEIRAGADREEMRKAALHVLKRALTPQGPAEGSHPAPLGAD
jgi:AcrR family transcriptional regulator